MAQLRTEPSKSAAADTQGAETPPVGTRFIASEAPEADSARTDEQEISVEPDTTKTGAIQNTKPHRLVPPPLRPATRGRTHRQGSGRARETFVTREPESSAVPTPLDSTKIENVASQATAALQTQVPPTPEASPTSPMEPAATVGAAVESGGEGTLASPATEAPKPARRYRFDRREPAAHTVIPSKPVSLAPSPAPTEPAGAGRARQENITPEQSPKPSNGSTESESVPTTESEGTAPAAPATHARHDRRRHGQEGQHAKTQPSIEANKDAVKADALKQADAARQDGQSASSGEQQVVETQAGVVEQNSTEVPVEDLPPLEYAELQAASRRRRRRRAGSAGGGATAGPAVGAANKPAAQVGPASIAPVAPATPATPARTPTGPSGAQAPFTIQSGMTVNQMNQGNDVAGPFQGPEPTPARGSVLPPQPRLTRAMRNGNEAQRGNVTGLPAARGGDGILSTGAVNHLANAISQAIQTQSDRLVAELRRTNQAGANVSVTVPPFPSTERVGVFVDVANLLYSARTLRTTIDFGKLLDFLRGNRRLVRAHAYTPTSPQPGDDQMFLQAVKGLGYRITTKNYKTFASGAKKADMDLDLCMDVVRLVDARAVDTIVLVSGDSDFIPLLDYCSDHGVRVEVVAFDESMSASLRQSCDLFINLSMLDEIRVS